MKSLTEVKYSISIPQKNKPMGITNQKVHHHFVIISAMKMRVVIAIVPVIAIAKAYASAVED